MEHRPVLQTERMQPAARYREFDPCLPLRDYVRCFFTFAVPAERDEPRRPVKRELLYTAPGSYTTPLFADSQVSISFSFGAGYRVDGLWGSGESRHCGHVIGAMSSAHPAAHGERVVEVGAYLRPAQAKRFMRTPACELTDRILPLADLWGHSGVSLEASIAEASSDDERVGQLELALIERLKTSANHHGSVVNISALASFVQQRRGDVGVVELADAAGVTRQHLGRMFQEEIGIPPKLFCRLARFRAALACAARDVKNDGAGMAAELGYTQSLQHTCSDVAVDVYGYGFLQPMPVSGPLDDYVSAHPLLWFYFPVI